MTLQFPNWGSERLDSVDAIQAPMDLGCCYHERMLIVGSNNWE